MFAIRANLRSFSPIAQGKRAKRPSFCPIAQILPKWQFSQTLGFWDSRPNLRKKVPRISQLAQVSTMRNWEKLRRSAQLAQVESKIARHCKLPFWQMFRATAILARPAATPRTNFQGAHHERNDSHNENHRDLIHSAFQIPHSEFAPFYSIAITADQTKVRRSGNEAKKIVAAIESPISKHGAASPLDRR
jgi:hypothetical protein